MLSVRESRLTAVSYTQTLIWNWLLNCCGTIAINGNIDQPEERLNNKINAWLIAWKYECYLSHFMLPFQLRDNGIVRPEHLRCSCWNFWCNFAYCFEAEDVFQAAQEPKNGPRLLPQVFAKPVATPVTWRWKRRLYSIQFKWESWITFPSFPPRRATMGCIPVVKHAAPGVKSGSCVRLFPWLEVWPWCDREVEPFILLMQGWTERAPVYTDHKPGSFGRKWGRLHWG